MLALYLFVVVTIGWVAQSGGSLWVSLAATAAVAVAVQPLRTLLQRKVDRLMYGDRNDPYAGLSRLADRLQATVEPREALRSIVDAVAEALRLPFVAIELARDNRFERAEQHGRPARGEEVECPLAYGATSSAGSWSRDVAPTSHSAPPIAGCCTTWRATPVPPSTRCGCTTTCSARAERLVLAREEERRRIRRDLHDGLGPTLASAVFQADAARDLIAHRALTRPTPQLAATCARRSQQAVDRRAHARLRPAAAGPRRARPGAALCGEQAARCRPRTGPRIAVDGAGRAARTLPAAVEVAAFRIAHGGRDEQRRGTPARAPCRVSLRVNGGAGARDRRRRLRQARRPTAPASASPRCASEPASSAER